MLPQFPALCDLILQSGLTPWRQGAVCRDLLVDHATGGALDRHVLYPEPIPTDQVRTRSHVVEPRDRGQRDRGSGEGPPPRSPASTGCCSAWVFEFRVGVLFIMMRHPVGLENPSPSLCVCHHVKEPLTRQNDMLCRPGLTAGGTTHPLFLFSPSSSQVYPVSRMGARGREKLGIWCSAAFTIRSCSCR